MVSIAAFQAVDPGSIPGQRIFFFNFLLNHFFLVSHALSTSIDESKFYQAKQFSRHSNSYLAHF